MSRATKEINKITGTIIGVSTRLIIYAIILLVVVEGISISYRLGHEIFYASSVDEAPGKDIEVVIPDSKYKDTTDQLYSLGLINNKLSFKVQEKFFDMDIKPGTYTLNTSKTSREILEELDSGPVDETMEKSE